MSQAKQNIEVQVGADFQVDMAVTDAAGNPLDLTGYTFAMQMRSSAGAAVPFLAPTASLVASTGPVRFKAPHTDTTGITAQGGVWDVQVTDPLGNVDYPRGGAVTVTPAVTR